jgi:drug/metabolite transporter (DMT)-like permease
MAETVQIAGTDYWGKIRNPLGIIGLTLITLGIYWIFWYYYLNKELAEMGKARNTDELGTSPGTSVLAVTLGAFILVPPFVSVYKTWERKCKAEDATGQVGMEAGLGFLLTILIGFVGMYILQSNLNKVLQSQAASGSSLPSAAPAPPIEQLAPSAAPFEQPAAAAEPVEQPAAAAEQVEQPPPTAEPVEQPPPAAEQPEHPPQQ